MRSKERIRASLEHRQPDKVCIDFGSTAVTGMHCSIVAALRKSLGLENRPVKIVETLQMLGEIDEELMEYLGSDIQGCWGESTIFGYENSNWKEWLSPWGQVVLVGKDFCTTEDDHAVYIYPEGDTSIAPSGQMPKSGFFFDAINRQKPLDEEALDPQDNLEEFALLSDAALQGYKERISLIQKSGRAVMAVMGGTAIGDIALVPATWLKDPKGIRDITEWYISTISRQDYLHQVFSAQTEIALKNLEKLNHAAGNAIDVLYICGTDFGTQTSSFCSPDTYRELYMPYYSKINNWIHQHTGWKTFKHSCGAVKDFIPLFIESGFDIFNPVQCSAKNMDPASLKKEFGSDIVFWGGAIDTQKTLPFGTPEDVRKESLERCEIFSKDGGFVFTSIHNIQANTPVENVLALISAVKEFNGEK
jgi:uroporphyrinogen-III decarboxylase